MVYYIINHEIKNPIFHNQYFNGILKEPVSVSRRAHMFRFQNPFDEPYLDLIIKIIQVETGECGGS